ncbi:MAG: TRAP transporter permease [Pseudomonadota bacterium]|nr:TRAP transporter permease [Pseudomonadota bacterium]
MKSEKQNASNEPLELEGRARILHSWQLIFTASIALFWSFFQLWYASPLPYYFRTGVFIDVPARAIHLAFALAISFLLFPAAKVLRGKRFNFLDFVFSLFGSLCSLYLYLEYVAIVDRNGVLLTTSISLLGFEFSIPLEMIIGGCGVVLLLEATRRAIGLPLVIVAAIFLLYSLLGQSMPHLIAHQGLSFVRLIGYHWLGGEAIFGIPISVSVSFVFLFVLFGSMLDQAGGGKYFLNLAVALVGRYKGGPAKAAILASGLTGMISGSSIANVVTTGTFTIPTMKRTGFSAVKAGAIEVAASVNGQIMPPIMGAAAFIIAEILGITYFQVITHAIIPAAITYLALFFIAHIEAHKHGLRRMEKNEIPRLWTTFISGVHYLVPIIILVYLLIIERWTAGSAVFYSILALMAIILGQAVYKGKKGSLVQIAKSLWQGLTDITRGMIRGAINMVPVAIAIACAGIIVGAVASTGLSNAMVEVVEIVSGGNFYILLFMVMILCLILGLGLPTTANYLVVAALLANVVVEIGGASGYLLPLIAVHLFVFYFGLMADVTPPVGLAAYAASGISRADPIKTGIQAFWYEIRTAILPFVFIFNPELLLVGVTSFWHAILIFGLSLIAILCFTAATQGWLLARLRILEIVGLLCVTLSLFRPDAVVGILSPAYMEIEIDEKLHIDLNKSKTLRIHVTRNTEYGDRFKLFTFEAKSQGRVKLPEHLGFSLREENNHYVIDQLAFNGKAKRKGIDFGDQLTAIEVRNPNHLSKNWGYIFGLLLLSMIFFRQYKRKSMISVNTKT